MASVLLPSGDPASVCSEMSILCPTGELGLLPVLLAIWKRGGEQRQVTGGVGSLLAACLSFGSGHNKHETHAKSCLAVCKQSPLRGEAQVAL